MRTATQEGYVAGKLAHFGRTEIVVVLNYFSRTDIGKKRKINQDYIFAGVEKIGDLSNLFIVADGMGGHAAGDYASRTSVEAMKEFIDNSFEVNRVKILSQAVETANNVVYAMSRSDRNLSGMGTTVVAATFVGSFVQIVNVGDSRAYIVSDKGIRQITVDHSLVEEMVKSGSLPREQARNHPEKNIITRAVGIKNTVEVDVFTEEIQFGDYVLLCSDGLTNMVTDEDIRDIILNSDDVEDAVVRLVDTANEQGGKDNISAILVRYEE